MTKYFYILLFFLSFSTTAQTIDVNYVDGAIYLKVDDSTTATLDISASAFPGLNSIFTAYSVTEIKQPFKGITIGLEHTYRVEFSQFSNVNAFLTTLNQLAYVDYSERVPLFYTSQVPNDMNTNQWYLTKINAPQGWDYTTGNVNVKIAIVDNAVSTTHEDLSTSIFINTGEIPGNGLDDDFNGYTDDYKGYDVANGDGDVNPPSSSTSSSPWIHGTHCSGIASASTNNNIGMAGLGFNCSIIPVKCTPNSSAGNTLNAAYEGVAYAMNAGADVISMSFGGSGTSFTGQNIINAAYINGITLVAAAGNDNTSAAFYPAAYTQVISVGATDISDQRAGFSNYGTTIDVMAPGVGIYSTLSGPTDDLYGNLSGTSMACPLTAGLCGLIKSQDLTRTPDQIKTILKNGCENIDIINPGFAGQLGAGRINAANSLGGIILSLPENEMEATILSQNPFKDEITIRVSINEMYVVYSSTGQIIETFKSDNEEFRLGRAYDQGVYFIVSKYDSMNKTLKVIKL
jgi:subtilisin family serine protease